MAIKFEGFQAGEYVAIRAENAGAFEDAVQPNWSSVIPDTGNFRVRVSILNEDWTAVSEGEVIEAVAPVGVRVWVDQFTGWVNNDPRFITCSVDMGERYDFAYTDHPDLPPELRALGGTTAGFYPGVLCGHAMRGTDMFGSQVLTGTHDQGNGAPLGTLDQTITVTVGDGFNEHTTTFTVRAIHPDAYYSDRTKVIFAGGTETERKGSIYVSADGDFSGAPAERAATTTVAGIYHFDMTGKRLGETTFDNVAGGGVSQCVQVLFKAGQSFDIATGGFNPSRQGRNASYRTWYHGGTDGDKKAVLDGRFASTFHQIGQTAIRSNDYGYHGWRFQDLVVKCSDYDPSDIAWREWWNVLNVSGLSGVLGENTEENLLWNDWNGEVISDGLGTFTQVISASDNGDGTQTLICRQVVDANHFADTKQPAEQSYFADGAILTGLTGGATMTFLAAGSRQDRTRKTPCTGFSFLSGMGIVFDGLEIKGPAVGIANPAYGCLISDTLIQNYWNYGAEKTAGWGKTSWAEVGVVGVQPLNYEAPLRDFGGAAVSANRNLFNVNKGVEGDPNNLTANDISHSYRRFQFMDQYSAHYCFASTYGGHGGQAPMHRLANDGAGAEGDMTVQIYGCGFSGGGSQMDFSTLKTVNVPYTPAVIRVERCHFRASFATQSNNFNCAFTNYVLRNCILDETPLDFDRRAKDIVWIAAQTQTYPGLGPDVNAVSPVVEFCTFRATVDTTAPSSVGHPVGTVREVPITYSNNAFIVDQSGVFAGVDTNTIALADAPEDFSVDLMPTVTATKSFQSALGAVVDFDANGVKKPAIKASKGAIEPTP